MSELLDAGGAMHRRGVGRTTPLGWPNLDAGQVVVKVSETHDGDPCGCVDEEMTLKVGDSVELTHTCHDGRVDKVTALVVGINHG